MRRVLLLAILMLAPAAALAQTPAAPAPGRARDTTARMAAVAELGRSRDPAALEPLLSALRDVNRDVRWVAIEALGELGDRRAVRPLVQYLRRNESYRWGTRLVANALGAIGGREALEALASLLGDPDPFVRRAAALAMLRQGDPAVLGQVAEVLQESPDDHLGTVKREFARLRDAGSRGGPAAPPVTAGRQGQREPVRPHEWAGLRIGSSTLADATERLGAPLQRTTDAYLFRGDGAHPAIRTESIVVNASASGPIESIFLFPVWGTLDRDVRAFLGNGRLLTYGEFLRVTGRTTFGAGTRADGKLHYLPPDLMTESFPDAGILVVYDSAEVAARDRLVKLVIVY